MIFSPARVVVAAFIVLSALAAGWLAFTIPPSTVSVNVRWSQDLPSDERSALERRFHLADGHPIEGRTWQYVLTDYSAANIRALVEHPAVEDTYRLNRVLYEPAEPPPTKTSKVAGGALLIGLTGSALVLVLVVVHVATGIDLILLMILTAALLLGLRLATTQAYIYDEDGTWIPISQEISFAPGHLHLPLRSSNHGALTAYLVRTSSALFGTTPLGYRLAHLLLAIVTIAVIFLLTRQWYGPIAARWAAALWAFNEYYLAVSARTTAQVPTLFFDVLGVYAFSRFLVTQRAAYLYAASVSIGLAFYCKENSALLLLVFFLALLQAGYRHWLRRPHVYLACATFLLVIGPDIYVNLTTHPAATRLTYAGQALRQETYGSHLQRIGGIAFSPYPSMFYARSIVPSLYARITGEVLRDDTDDYHSVNPAVGLLLVGAVLITTFRPAGRDQIRRFLLLSFWVVFVFYSLIKPGDPPGRLNPATWIWVEVTMIPAVILAGARLAGASAKWRPSMWLFSAGALAYAVAIVLG